MSPNSVPPLPDWLTRQHPAIVAHRGGATHVPENTLAGIRFAGASPAVGIEIDVKLTADDVPIVIHDDYLDRTTSGEGPVAEATLARIRALDAGSWFGPGHAGEKVPLLSEAIALCHELGLGMNIEIKPCPGRAVRTAKIALRLARDMWPADIGPPIVSSFDPACLEVSREEVPDWPRGLLTTDLDGPWLAKADAVAATAIHVHGPAMLTTATQDGSLANDTGRRPILAWTVNDPMMAVRLSALDIAGLITDDPGRLARALTGR